MGLLLLNVCLRMGVARPGAMELTEFLVSTDMKSE